MKLFHSYKKQYELAVKVMGAMAEEIIKLREENDKLANANVSLQVENGKLHDDANDLAEICNEQSETLAMLHDKFRRAREALAK